MRRLQRGVALQAFLLARLKATQEGTSQSEVTSNVTSNPEGKAAAEKLTKVLGGEAKVNAVKTLHQSLTLEQEGAEMQIELSVVYPDRQVQTIKTPQGEVIQVLTPASAFLKMGTQVRDLPPPMHKSQLPE